MPPHGVDSILSATAAATAAAGPSAAPAAPDPGRRTLHRRATLLLAAAALVLAASDDPGLQHRLTVMAARVRRALPQPIPARPSRLAIAADAVGAELHAF